MSKKPKKIILIICACFLFVQPVFGETAPITSVSVETKTAYQYELFELSIILSKHYKNPHDVKIVDLAAFIKSADGYTMKTLAYYSGKNNVWKIRFTPTEHGKYSYRIRLKTSTKTYLSPVSYFTVHRNNTGNGFLRKGKKNPYYPIFDSGRQFFGIGHNIAWVSGNDPNIYRKYYSAYQKNGCNLTRIWINCPWTLNVESSKLGKINYTDCRKIDELLRISKEYGVYIILVLDSYASIMAEEGDWGEEAWKINPYNKINGGPCSTPDEFFTNKEAKRHYKNRLRYIMARWGYSPNIICFELFNETDVPKEWAREMFSLIKSANPHRQLTSISLGYPWSNNFDESAIWSLSDINIIQRHLYGNQQGDAIGSIISVNNSLRRKYAKPVILGEFGINSARDDKFFDSKGDGTSLHNSIWASLVSGSFCSALNWWWAGYIRPKQLYYHYNALRKFVSDLDFSAHDIRIPDISPVKYKPSDKEITYSDVTLKTGKVWGEKNYSKFIIHNNGDLSGGIINYYLHGSSKKQLKIKPIFHVDYPKGGKFIIHVDVVSQGGELQVLLDNKTVAQRNFTAGPGKGPWKKSLYIKDHDIYQCIYNTQVEVGIPGGKHTIKIKNNGTDWIGIKKLTLTSYRQSDIANVRVAGISLDGTSIFWIQNKFYNWKNSCGDIPIAPIQNSYFDVGSLKDGAYKLEWWDTLRGIIIHRDSIKVKAGKVRINIPTFANDLALKIIPVKKQF